MRVRLLGTAAGGGVPQWNCRCALCREARAGSSRLRPRTQSSVAISADDQRWFLLNASPDVRFQIENFSPLHPPPGGTRGSPIQGVLLTNADLDHSLGLLLLREGQKLVVHATDPVRDALTRGIALDAVMNAFCGIEWRPAPEHPAPLLCRDGSPSELRFSAFAVPGKPPRFMGRDAEAFPGNSVGYRILDETTGGSLVFVPDIASAEPSLLPALADCTAVLFDGTFWSENEMVERGAGEITAAEMGHMPISGEQGSLKMLAALPAENKVYIHINNTNPILLEDSPERAAVERAGVQVGFDGMEFMI